MTLPNETLATGAATRCPECGGTFTPKVMQSMAGYYVGIECPCGPWSRESDYYPTRESVQHALDTGDYGRD